MCYRETFAGIDVDTPKVKTVGAKFNKESEFGLIWLQLSLHCCPPTRVNETFNIYIYIYIHIYIPHLLSDFVTFSLMWVT